MILLFCLSLFGADYKILVITNENPVREDTKAFKDGLNHAISEVYKKYDHIKIETTNVYVDRKDEKKLQKDLEKLRKLLKKRYLFIIAPGISKTFGEVAKYLPIDTPVITGSSAINELLKYKGTLFSTGNPPKYSKARDLKVLKKLIKYKKIINLYDKKPGKYPNSILDDFKQNNKDIPIINLDINKLNKEFLQKYIDDSLVFVSADGSKTCKTLIDRFYFIVKNIEFLYDKKYNFNYFVSYYSPVYEYKTDRSVFTSSSVYTGKKNIYEYDYLKDVSDKDEKYIKRFDDAFRWYYPKILLGLKDLSFDNSLDVMHRLIYNNLKKTTIEHPFVEKRTRYIYAFEKEDGVFYNVIRKYGILNNYLFVLNGIDKKVFYPVQIFDNKKHTVVYVIPEIKRLKVLTLDAQRVKIDMIVRVASMDESLKFGEDITLKPIEKESLDIKLLSKKKIKFFKNISLYYKVYSVSFIATINSKLFDFPYDEQVINIDFYSNDFSKKPILIQMINNKNKYLDTISDNWYIVKHFPSFTKNIYKVENGLDSSSKVILTNINHLTIKIKRKEPFQIIMKYFLPAIILLFLAVYISYYIFKKYSQNHISIVSDVLLGIISIYFIYSLLIQIETLIVMDLIFYGMILFVIVLIFVILMLERAKKVKS